MNDFSKNTDSSTADKTGRARPFRYVEYGLVDCTFVVSAVDARARSLTSRPAGRSAHNRLVDGLSLDSNRMEPVALKLLPGIAMRDWKQATAAQALLVLSDVAWTGLLPDGIRTSSLPPVPRHREPAMWSMRLDLTMGELALMTDLSQSMNGFVGMASLEVFWQAAQWLKSVTDNEELELVVFHAMARQAVRCTKTRVSFRGRWLRWSLRLDELLTSLPSNKGKADLFVTIMQMRGAYREQ